MMFLVFAESKVSDRRHLSGLVSLALVASTEADELHTWCQGMALYVREGYSSFQQSKLECSCHETCVFRICSRINNLYVYAFYRNPWHDGLLYYCLLDSLALVQSVVDTAVFVFVSDANAHHSERLKLVSPSDRHGRDALDFLQSVRL